MVHKKIEEKILRAEEKCAEIQPWPGYFRLKGEELKVFFDLFDRREFGSILEIGCGNAFNSVMLSEHAKRTVATDIPQKNSETHSIGLDKAEQLIKRLDIRNVDLVPCVSEQLPFPDRTFDTVFSFYVLEHVMSKQKSLTEIRRVLKDDGMVVSIVPNFVERIFNGISQYMYMTKRLFFYMGNKISGRKEKKPPSSDTAVKLNAVNSRDMTVSRFREIYPNFPFPEPHGNYKSAVQELFQHMPVRWIELFKENGFSIENVFTTVIVPWGLFELCGAYAPLNIYRAIPRKGHALGRMLPFKYFGNNLCIIARKNNDV